jgi:hypothetical protein
MSNRVDTDDDVDRDRQFYERHERGLDAFYEHFPQAEEAVVVTLDRFEEALEPLMAR